jgi:RNA polymerase sigma-70 factor (ECF subfamily)
MGTRGELRWDVSVAGERDDLITNGIVGLQPNLYRFARSLTRDAEEAADLAQEATARALRARRSFTPGTNLKAWLFRIVRNVHLNRVRNAGVDRLHLNIDEAPADVAGPRTLEHEVLVRAEVAAVARALRNLPEALRIPLYLTAVEGMSYADVARRLEVPIGTVMSRIYRARRRLLVELAEGWE